MESNKPTVLVLMDLSAAFDTVDRNSSIRHRNLVALSDAAFNLFVPISRINISLRVWIRAPLENTELGDFIRRHSISFHSCFDNTQLCIAMSSDVKLSNCLFATFLNVF